MVRSRDLEEALTLLARTVQEGGVESPALLDSFGPRLLRGAGCRGSQARRGSRRMSEEEEEVEEEDGVEKEGQEDYDEEEEEEEGNVEERRSGEEVVYEEEDVDVGVNCTEGEGADDEYHHDFSARGETREETGEAHQSIRTGERTEGGERKGGESRTTSAIPDPSSFLTALAQALAGASGAGQSSSSTSLFTQTLEHLQRELAVSPV